MSLLFLFVNQNYIFPSINARKHEVLKSFYEIKTYLTIAQFHANKPNS